jgi:hypothetical protein
MKINQKITSRQNHDRKWNWCNIPHHGVVQLAIRAPLGFLTMPRPKLKPALPQIF